jgi:prophage regulatory protein
MATHRKAAPFSGAIQPPETASSVTVTRPPSRAMGVDRSTFRDYLTAPESFQDYFMRRGDVERFLGLGRSAIYDGVSAGTFPAPVQLGRNSVAWLASEVFSFAAARLAERDRSKRRGRGARPIQPTEEARV